MEDVTLCTSLITLKTLSLMSRNVMLVQPCEWLWPWSQDSSYLVQAPHWQTHISF